ncbi:Mrp/NBP35 family ATP-binding protein [Clostridium omnivorum]|uniref:Iron-sulfur cluster carrier protein n=1 Tax=Clostridium omnivorum TaxID=1604902 RepID=A0ABQ5N6X8_9CLOT|nr:Mrp/NBP35 family ATP-binding protein [Clostridium sp. E14]GLC31008.1 iron-sulfur cluster carrier protein [Clostridium sp. E14]
MGKCESCASKGKCGTNEASCSALLPKYGSFKNIIAVMSGKGGVGKSTVTGILATKLRHLGYSVGVLDGDITGPSMPRFFGINEKRAEIIPVGEGQEVKFLPVETSTGIRVNSLNLLTEVEEQPVIWRGPVITSVLTQMYTDTEWGDLDYLLIDMPPGTGDVALTVLQSVPVTGIVVAATPQDMVTMIVKKVVIMAQKMNKKVIGVVENMSYVKCHNCDERIRVFSKKTGAEQAEALGIPLLSELPINLDLVEKMEQGEAEAYINIIQEYNELVDRFIELK